jgi:hypothetical protein
MKHPQSFARTRIALAIAGTGALALSLNLAAAGPAHADSLPHSMNMDGTQCRAYGWVTSLDLYAVNVSWKGVTNGDDAQSRMVICPVVRYADSPSATVYVDGFVNPGHSVICTLYSHDFDGTYKGSVAFSRNGSVTPGTFDEEMTIPKATTYSYHSVVCGLPPNEQGGIFGVIALR